MCLDYCSSICQLLGSLVLAVCIDDFGTSLTLGFCLLCHRPLHLDWQVNLLYFDCTDFDAPWLSVLINNFLELFIDSVPFRKQFIHVRLAQDTAESCLCNLVC